MDIDLGRWDLEAAAVFQKAQALPMPLVHSSHSAAECKALLRRRAIDLFPGAKLPDELLAGLLLRMNCWDESHQVAQDLSSPEGSYWHAIVHRMEPDYGNAGYWFRRVGQHAIFPELLKRSAALADRYPQVRLALSRQWKPETFTSFCEEAARKPGSDNERLALEIQQEEWKLLMEWCA